MLERLSAVEGISGQKKQGGVAVYGGSKYTKDSDEVQEHKDQTQEKTVINERKDSAMLSGD